MDTDEQLHRLADEFVSAMNRDDRDAWLARQGFTTRQIREARRDPDPFALDELARDHAHAIAADVLNGARTDVPEWLR